VKVLHPLSRGASRGSTLVIVLWVALGLVSLALYFGHSTALELRSADHRAAAIESEQAISGAARFACYVVTNLTTPGVITDLEVAPTYRYVAEAVPVGDAKFWFIGRDANRQTTGMGSADPLLFKLVDESSKLNLNTATAEMLSLLPRMTPELAAAIVDWRDTNEEVSDGGAEEETYARFNPPYRCKNAPFESVDELRMVAGMTMLILAGEDTNRNGILDPNEDDLDTSAPWDNRDGRIDPGLLEYVTVFSKESQVRADGTAKISIGAQGRQDLATLLSEKFSASRGNEILGALGNPNQAPASLLEFFVRSRMTIDEFVQIEGELTAATAQQPATGLVNVNTATEAVLACIPGIGTDMAPNLVSYRRSNPNRLNTVAWVSEVLERERAVQAGRYLTGRSAVYSADVAAVGHLGRGYRRVRFVIDSSEGGARIVHRQDLTHLGWALGRQVWQQQEQLISRNMR
jgi:DNA uptake protein ComE-like DNA-binding protein